MVTQELFWIILNLTKEQASWRSGKSLDFSVHLVKFLLQLGVQGFAASRELDLLIGDFPFSGEPGEFWL